jgi:hypothetical protein
LVIVVIVGNMSKWAKCCEKYIIRMRDLLFQKTAKSPHFEPETLTFYLSWAPGYTHMDKMGWIGS